MPTVPLFTQLCCNSVIITETLEHPRPCQLEMEQVMTTGCKSTLSRKARGRDTGKHQNKKGTLTNNNTSNTDINTCKNCGRTGHWVKDCSRPGGRADNNSKNNDNNDNNDKNKGKNNRKGKGKGKQLELLQTLPLSETASTATY